MIKQLFSLLLFLKVTQCIAQGDQVQKIVVVFKSHFDIGYTKLAREVIHDYQTSTIDHALQVVDKSKSFPSDQQFVWTVPGWPMKKILEDWSGQTGERKAKVHAAFREGRFTVHAFPFTMQTEMVEPEALVRGLEFASQVSRTAGKPIPIAAKMTDVPSHSWILPTLLTHAGIHFLHLGSNPASSSPQVPTLFWWQGPDGSKLLTMYSNAYGSGLFPPEGWKLKTWLALQMRGDNAGPPEPEEVKAVVDEIHAKLPNVQVVIGHLDDFAGAVLKENPDVPVVRSDMPDTWIHGPMCDPEGVKTARQNLPSLFMAEAVHSLLNLWKQPQPDISKPLAEAYENSILFYEHTWGGAMYWLTKYLPPKDNLGYVENWRYDSTWQQDLKNGRFDRIIESWEEHTNYARHAAQIINPLLKRELTEIADNVTLSGKKKIVFNPLPWPRGGIPSMGYKAFPIHQSSFPKRAVPKIDRLKNTLENNFFLVKINPEKGAVESIIHKKTNREMVDNQSTHGFGQVLYQKISAHEVKNFNSTYIREPTDWGFAEIGKPNMPPVSELAYKELTTNSCHLQFSTVGTDVIAEMAYQPQKGALHFPVNTKIILHGNQPYIDIEVTIDKPATPTPEDVWLCFPIRADRPQFRVGRHGSIIDPVTDITVGGVNRYMYAVGTGVAVFGQNGAGMGICGIETPLVSLGMPGDWKFDNTYTPFKPIVYYNLFNNHWSTNYRFWNGGKWNYHFRIWSFEKYNPTESLITPAFETRYPLQVIASDSKAGKLPTEEIGLQLSRKGVMVTALGENRTDKKGYLLRLWEQTGETGMLTVTLPRNTSFTKAIPVDLRGEVIGKEINVLSGKFRVYLPAYSPAGFILSTNR